MNVGGLPLNKRAKLNSDNLAIHLQNPAPGAIQQKLATAIPDIAISLVIRYGRTVPHFFSLRLYDILGITIIVRFFGPNP
jgi:hypothetical protein